MGAGNGVTCATQKDPSPVEISNYSEADIPDSSQLHNAQVEPICRKYLELRCRMLPYLYSAARECTTTGMPSCVHYGFTIPTIQWLPLARMSICGVKTC